MQFNQLRYVVQVSEKGSFSEAAKALFIAQPSLSQQVIKLERELGVKLFERRMPSVVLTPAGREFVAGAKEVLDRAEQLQKTMNRYRPQQRIHLRVGVGTEWWHHTLLHLLTSSKMSQEVLSLSLVVKGDGELVDLLERRQLDCAFLDGCEGPGDWPDLWTCNRKMDCFLAVVPRDHPLSQRTELQPDDFSGQKLWMPQPYSPVYGEVIALLERAGICPEFLCSSLEGEREQQLGISFVEPWELENRTLKDCSVIPVRVEYPGTVCLAIPQERLQDPNLQLLAQYFVDATA